MVYTPPEYITAADLNIRAGGATSVRQLADDDGDGQADPAVLTAIIQEASAIADSYLLDAFGIQQIAGLAADPMFKGAVADIALSLLGERRADLGGFDAPGGSDVRRGQAPWSNRRRRGEETLDKLGKSWRRSAAESSDPNVGPNAARLYPQVFSLPSDGWELP